MNRIHKIALLIATTTALALASAGTAAAQGPAPVTCEGLTATIAGTSGNNRIVGTSGADVIWAGAGNDLVNGRGGADTICGNSGDDRLRGESGADRISGGSGNDDCSSSSADTRSGCQSGTMTRFMPTRHGFPFPNFFTIDRTIEYPGGSYSLSAPYGLCGGMVFAALDTFEASDTETAPGTATTPTSGQTYNYIRDRLVDSLTVNWGSNLAGFIDLQGRSDSELEEVTADTAIEVREMLEDNGNQPIPLGVVFAEPDEPIYDNHQVLVIGYFKRSGEPRILQVYDPNRPDQISYVNTGTMEITDQDGSDPVDFRAVFVEQYEERTPPWA